MISYKKNSMSKVTMSVGVSTKLPLMTQLTLNQQLTSLVHEVSHKKQFGLQNVPALLKPSM